MKSKFKVENQVVFLFSVFYIIAGAVEVFYVVAENFAPPPHIGVLGLLSLITAYGLFKMKKWSVFLAVGLFFTGITFGATTLNTSIIVQTFGGALLFHLVLIAYIIMLSIALIYILAKRSDFN